MASSALSSPSTPPTLPAEDLGPRDRRGRRHPRGRILLTALCAVLAGSRCLGAIGLPAELVFANIPVAYR